MAYSDLVIADGASYYWRLEEAVGPTTFATVGGAHGTISGGVTLNQPGALDDGVGAMAFNGTTGQILTVASVPIPLTATIEGWIKFNASTGHKPIFATYQVGGTSGDTVYAGVYGQAPYFISSAAAVGAFTSVPLGIWNHLVYVLDGSTVTFYLNGVLNDSKPQTRTTPSDGPAMIGNAPTVAYLAGTLDEVAVYPLALSPAQIQAHYNARSSGTLVPHVANAPGGCNEKMAVYFDQVLYVGTDSTDLTTNLVRRLKALSGEMTARFKQVIVAAGSSN